MKIIFDARYIAIHGGICEFVQSYIAGVVALGRKMSFIFSESQLKTQIFKTVEKQGFDIIIIKSLPFQLKEHWELGKILKKQKKCLLHVPHFNVPLYTPANVKIITTIHDIAFDFYPKEFKTIFHKFYYVVIMKKILSSAKIVAASGYTAQTIKDVYGVTDVDRIYDCYSPKVEFHTYAHRDGKTFLYVGTNKPRKNLKFLIDVFEVAPSDYKLIVVGDLYDKNYLIHDDVLSRKLENKILIKGYVSKDELHQLYAECKALLFPSLLEGFGYPILEAATFGIPVICSSTGSLPEIGGKGCLYFNPYDHNDCLTKMRKIIEDSSLCENLVNENRKRVSLFTKEKCVDAYMSLYDKLSKSFF